MGKAKKRYISAWVLDEQNEDFLSCLDKHGVQASYIGARFSNRFYRQIGWLMREDDLIFVKLAWAGEISFTVVVNDECLLSLGL